MLHLFNYLSFYTDSYMKTVKREHWTGYYRKKVAMFGKVTIWIRTGKSTIVKLQKE